MAAAQLAAHDGRVEHVAMRHAKLCGHVRQVAGMPLGILLAAAWTRSR